MRPEEYIKAEAYLREHENATLKEFIEATKENEQKKAEYAKEMRKQELAYYHENFDGKYVCIKFHNDAYRLYGPFPSFFRDADRIPCIDIYACKNESAYRVKYEEDATFNSLWFQNPYSMILNFSKPSVECIVISKEIFEYFKQTYINKPIDNIHVDIDSKIYGKQTNELK